MRARRVRCCVVRARRFSPVRNSLPYAGDEGTPNLRAKVTPRGVSLCIRLAPWCPFAHDKNCGTTSFAVYLYALLRATP